MLVICQRQILMFVHSRPWPRPSCRLLLGISYWVSLTVYGLAISDHWPLPNALRQASVCGPIRVCCCSTDSLGAHKSTGLHGSRSEQTVSSRTRALATARFWGVTLLHANGPRRDNFQRNGPWLSASSKEHRGGRTILWFRTKVGVQIASTATPDWILSTNALGQTFRSGSAGCTMRELGSPARLSLLTGPRSAL